MFYERVIFFELSEHPQSPLFFQRQKTIPTYAWQVGREMRKIFEAFEFSCLSLTSS